MFYKKRESNIGLIKIPTLIYKKKTDKGDKYYEFKTTKFEIFTEKGADNYNNKNVDYALKIGFYIKIDDFNNRIFTTSLLEMEDGGTEVVDNVTYVFEFNDLNKRWYARTYDKNEIVKLLYKATIVSKTTGEQMTESIYYESSNVKFSEITDTEIVMSCKEEFEVSGSTLQAISSIPNILTNDENETYFWIGKEQTYIRDNDKNELSISGDTYKIYNSSFYDFKIKRIDDFVSRTSKDSYNEDYNSIEVTAPILISSIVKKYGFNETTVVYSSLDSKVQAKSWVSSNNAITNEHPNNVVNGIFLTTKACALVNDKYYKTWRMAPKTENNEYIVDKSGKPIKMKIRAKDSESSSHELRFWEIILLQYIVLGKEEYDDGKLTKIRLVSGATTVSTDTTELSGKTNKEAAEYILNNMITWVKIDDDTYNNYFMCKNGPKSGVEIDIAPHHSLMDEGRFDCWDLKLQRYGDKYYYQGSMNIRNVAQENINITDRRYTNCNPPQILPYLNSYKSVITDEWAGDTKKEYVWWENDIKNVKTHFFKSPVLGETYVYMDLLKYGTIDENGYFELTSEFEEQGSFPGVGTLGVQYGHYEPIRTGHQTKKDGLFYYHVDGSKKLNIDEWKSPFSERDGVGSYDPDYHPYSNATSIYDNPYESSDYYDNLVNIYQPNINNEIVDGTEMITCLLSKTYFDTNDEYRFKFTTSFNQSTNFSVAPIYIGQPIMGDFNHALVPFYLIDGMNEEIKKGFEDENIKYYFNCEEVIYSKVKDEIEKVKNITCDIYPSFNSLLFNKSYGYSNFSYEIKDRIDDKEFTPISSPNAQNNDNWYFGFYENLDVKINKEYNISDSNINLRIRKINSKCTRNVIKITPIYNVADSHKAIEKNIFSGSSESAIYTGNTITLDLDAPLSSFSLFYFSTQNGETYEINGETRNVDLLDSESIIENKIYKPFSSFWKMNKENNQLEMLEGEKLENISKSYSDAINKNMTIGAFFKEVMTHCGYYDSKFNDDIVNGLINAFDTAFNKNNLVLTSLMPHRVYVYNNQEYVSVGDGDKQLVFLSFNRPLEESLPNDGRQIIKTKENITLNSNFFMLISDIEIIKDDIDPNAFIIDLTDPYDKDLILQKFNFYGFEVNNQYKRLKKISNTEYLFLDIENENAENKVILQEINKSLSSLDVDKYIKIIDKRIDKLYPTAFERINKFLSIDCYLCCGCGVKNKENNGYISFKDLNVDTHYALYDRLNIFNKIKSYNDDLEIEHVPLSSGITGDYWSNTTVYQKDADIVFLKCAKITVQDENYTQIICDDGYTTIGIGSEQLTVINSNGDKENFSYSEIRKNSMLGLSLYHLTEVDGIYYEFVSKISKVKEINKICVLRLNLEDLVANQIYVLSLEVNNLIYKLPFTYTGIHLIPNFTNIDDKK
jgi:hypothetical protein